MKRGRKPKPTDQKLRAGNPGKRKLRPDRVRPGLSLPFPPDWLPAQAVAVWNELAALLVDEGLLTDMDRGALADLCMAERMKRGASAYLEGTLALTDPLHRQFQQMDDTRKVVNTLREYANLARLLRAGFGMTPSDRAGLAGGKKKLDPDAERELAAVRPFTKATAVVVAGGKD